MSSREDQEQLLNDHTCECSSVYNVYRVLIFPSECLNHNFVNLDQHAQNLIWNEDKGIW